MAYIGKSPDGTGVRSRFYYTQTSGGGTSVSGSSDDGTTLTFSDGAYVDVFLNGVLLVAGTDYNTTTANTIAGLAALASGDVVEVVVYDIFTVADTVSALNGGTFSNSVIIDKDGGTALTLDRATSDGTVMELQKGGTAFGRMSVSDANNLSIDCTTTDHAGLTFATENILPRKNSANTDNAVDLGAGSARFKNAYLSGNLYIGGTGSANALDDYEEGTWTPTPTVGTVTLADAAYTKIGRKVTVTFNVFNFSDRSSSSHIEFTNLPFTSDSSIGSTANAGMHRYVNAGPALAFYIPRNQTKIQLFSLNAGSNWTATQYAHLNSTQSDIYVHLTYFAA
jgi:hypothetical protein